MTPGHARIWEADLQNMKPYYIGKLGEAKTAENGALATALDLDETLSNLTR